MVDVECRPCVICGVSIHHRPSEWRTSPERTTCSRTCLHELFRQDARQWQQKLDDRLRQALDQLPAGVDIESFTVREIRELIDDSASEVSVWRALKRIKETA